MYVAIYMIWKTKGFTYKLYTVYIYTCIYIYYQVK